MLPKVDATLTAGHLLSQVPGLRERVEETLTGIIETAEEMRRLNGLDLSVTAVENPMRLHVGEYVIYYLLDLNQHAARVVFVEMVRREETAPSNDTDGIPRAS